MVSLIISYHRQTLLKFCRYFIPNVIICIHVINEQVGLRPLAQGCLQDYEYKPQLLHDAHKHQSFIGPCTNACADTD